MSQPYTALDNATSSPSPPISPKLPSFRRPKSEYAAATAGSAAAAAVQNAPRPLSSASASTTSPSSPGPSNATGYFPPLGGPAPVPHRFTSFGSASPAGSMSFRMPSEEARVLATSVGDSRPGSMILYRFASASKDNSDEVLLPPRMPASRLQRDSSANSVSDNADRMSLLSVNGDSKYPLHHLRDQSSPENNGSSGANTPRHSTLIAYAYDPYSDSSNLVSSTDPPDEEDYLHDPATLYDKKTGKEIQSHSVGLRGMMNVVALLALVGALLALFVIYPAIKFSHPNLKDTLIADNLRINRTGQAVGDDVPVGGQVPIGATAAATTKKAAGTSTSTPAPATAITTQTTAAAANTDDTLTTATTDAGAATTTGDGTGNDGTTTTTDNNGTGAGNGVDNGVGPGTGTGNGNDNGNGLTTGTNNIRRRRTSRRSSRRSSGSSSSLRSTDPEDDIAGLPVVGGLTGAGGVPLPHRRESDAELARRLIDGNGGLSRFSRVEPDSDR